MEQLKRLTIAFWDAARKGQILLESETSWFVLASALDFAMTYILLQHPHDEDARFRFIESNPVAVFFLNHWGVKGLFCFKLAIVTLVVVICQIVARHNVKLARRVLYLGTAIVTTVVIYSMFLHQAHTRSWE